MTGRSARTSKPDRRTLRLEELEERIAPVIVTADPGTWITGNLDDDAVGTTKNSWGPDTGDNDTYWIFYLGPGQADIRNTGGGADINGSHIGDITITGSDDTSALFILDFPEDPVPNQDNVPWLTAQGTLWVRGDITVAGDIGNITIDGLYGNFGFGQPTLSVNGTLGKLDVGMLLGNVAATEDIYEIHVDGTLGAVRSVDNPDIYSVYNTNITAAGNIGAIRVGVGLTDQGADVENTSIIGGVISGGTVISANSDETGPPGIIDLIEVRAGSLHHGGLGAALGDTVPFISAGPGGNVRFVRLDGVAYISGPGSSTILSEITVDSLTPLIERTIVDDSGGVLTINPQDTEFILADGSIVVYPGQVSWLAIPVARGLQGPGAIVARLSTTNSNNFGVTGNVEIGELRSSGNFVYGEGLATDFEDPLGPQNIDELLISGAGDILELEGYARNVFSGTGEADIYFVSSMSEFVGSGSPGIAGTIPIILNNTHDGDIVAAGADDAIIFIGASNRGGDVGATESISPYILRGPLHYQDGDVVWVDVETDAANDPSPYGVEGSLMRNNSIYGVFSDGNIYGVQAGGAIGDVRSVNGNIELVVANSNNVRDLGSPIVGPHIVSVPGEIMIDSFAVRFHDASATFFGKISNDVGDGVFGRIGSGTGATFRDSQSDGWSGDGSVYTVRLGEGLASTVIDPNNFLPEEVYDEGPGVYVGSGIYTAGFIGTVTTSGVGNDIHGNIIATGTNGATGFGIERVSAINGAAIVGNNIRVDWGSATLTAGHRSLIYGGTVNAMYQPSDVTSDIGSITSSGAGGVIDNMSITAQEVGRVVTSGGADGILNTSIVGFSGGIDMVSAAGTGIQNCEIFANGPAGTIMTTGAGATIEDTDILVLSGLKVFKTTSLINDDIDVVTVGTISSFDTIQNTTFRGGGLRNIRVLNDVSGSLIQVAGPLTSFRIGGDLLNTTIEATGPFGDMGRILVTGDIMNSEITSEQDISMVQSRTGSITNTDITARASGDLNANLVYTRFANVSRIMAAGDISGTISIGVLEFADLTGFDNSLIVRVGTIKAGGSISADITIAAGDWTGDIGGDLDIKAYVGTIMAGGDITGTIRVGSANAVAGGGELGDINGDVDITARVSRIKSGGNMEADFSVGIVQSANDINGSVDINSLLGSVLADGAVSGNINIGAVIAANDINGVVNVPETLGLVRAGGAVSGDILVGAVTSGGAINNDVTFRGRISSIRADGDISSDIRVGNENATGGVAGAIAGTGTVGSLISGGSVTGNIGIRSNLSTIRADGDVGNDGGVLWVGGRLGSIRAGDRDTVGDLLSDVTVIGNAGLISATGAFPGSLNVGGNLGRLSTVGDAGEATDAFTIGGRLGLLKVGDADTFSDLLASVNVTGNLGSILLTGDLENTVDVGGNAGRIIAGRIFSDITIGDPIAETGNLSYLRTGSGVQDGVDPVDLEFINPGFPTGTLTVGGRIGLVV